jgi:prepilin peptidase CpaA
MDGELGLRITGLAIGTIVVVAAVTDCWKGKIYNWLTLPALAIAPLWHAFRAGWGGFWFSLAGFGIVAGILVALTLLAGKGLGGGDLKLMAAVGALGGWHFALWALLFIALSGVVIAVPVMLRRRIVGYTLRNLAVNLSLRYMADQREVSVAEGSRGGRVPYGVSIALGTLIALFYSGIIP